MSSFARHRTRVVRGSMSYDGSLGNFSMEIMLTTRLKGPAAWAGNGVVPIFVRLEERPRSFHFQLRHGLYA